MFNTKTIILAKALRPDLNFASPGAEELVWLKIASRYASGNPVRDATISNGIAYFDRVSVSQPLVSLKLNIPVTQTGSGTPAPDNIRDFISFSGVNIGQTSGYGEYFRGLLNGTYGFVDLGSLTWYLGSQGYWYCSPYDLKSATLNYIYSNTLWTAKPENVAWANMTNGQVGVGGVQFRVKDTNYSTASDFRNSVSGVYLIYELATPVTPTITPEQFATLCQAFGITGNTYQIIFGQTVYSANLDVLTGKLSITHGIVDLGVVSYTQQSTGIVVLTKNNIQSATGLNPKRTSDLDILCSVFSTENRTLTATNNGIRFVTDVLAENFASTYNGQQLVFELAEPIEIQLTPTQIITTLIGENVIFADVANVTECKYTRK